MKEVYLRFFLFLWILPAMHHLSAQEVEFNPADSSFHMRYADFDMQGNFCMMVFAGERKNYYLADFTMLPERFDKIWFMNLVFKDTIVVNADRAIDRERIWFTAENAYPERVVTARMESLRQETLRKSGLMTAGEKSEYLRMNDKYQKRR